MSFAALGFDDLSSRITESTQLLDVEVIPVFKLPKFHQQMLYDQALDPTYK